MFLSLSHKIFFYLFRILNVQNWLTVCIHEFAAFIFVMLCHMYTICVLLCVSLRMYLWCIVCTSYSKRKRRRRRKPHIKVNNITRIVRAYTVRCETIHKKIQNFNITEIESSERKRNMEALSSLVKVTLPNYLSNLPIPDSFTGWFKLGGKFSAKRAHFHIFNHENQIKHNKF